MNTIGTVLLVLLLMFLFAPEDLGEHAAKVNHGFDVTYERLKMESENT